MITFDSVCTRLACDSVYVDNDAYLGGRHYSQAERGVILSLYVEKSGASLEVVREALLWCARQEERAHFNCIEQWRARDQVEPVLERLRIDEHRAFGSDPRDYGVHVGEPLGATIACLPWERAAAAWTMRFCELFPDWDEQARAAVWRDGVRELGEGMS